MSDRLVTRVCQGDVADVLARLRAALEQRGITLFAVIDHAQAARDAGLDLPDEVVAIFGNPAVGTRLMQHDPRVGIDLPLRMLLWDAAGTTMLAYSKPDEIADRFSMADEASVFTGLETVLEGLADAIAESVSRA